MMTATGIAFVLKHWRAILGGLGFLVLGLMLVSARSDARHWQKVAESCATARKLEQAAIQTKTAEAKAADVANVVRGERKQVTISNERSQSYESRLSSLHARHDAGRVRSRPEGPTAQGGGGDAGMSQVPNTPRSPDETSPTGDLSFNCQANAIQLDELQNWVREQQAVNTDAPPG